MTEAYKDKLLAAVRRRPRSFGLPFSWWALQLLVGYLAEQTGIRVSYESGPATPRKSRADQVSPLAQVSPILTEPLASLYNYGAWLHKRQRLLPAGP